MAIETTQTFGKREIAITKIASLAARGDLERLEKAVEEALSSKILSQNEIGEICLQLYAYAGFPRSLNAQGVLSSAVKNLEEKKISFEKGSEPQKVPDEGKYDNGREVINKIFGTDAKQARPESTGYAAATDVFLKEHLFNDITSRSNLSYKDRELATASMLAALGNVNPQLGAHLGGTINTGTSAKDLEAAWISVINETCGFETASNAKSVLENVAKEDANSSYKMTREEFEALDPFGVGAPNAAFAKYFKGNSYLKPLTDFKNGEFPLFNVSFEPACRNNWHIHHAESGGGQILICTAGSGWYQEWGKKAVSLTPGMVIVIPAGVKHWHGAKKDSWFSHIAIEVPGKKTSNEWCEEVSDEDYNKLQLETR